MFNRKSCNVNGMAKALDEIAFVPLASLVLQLDGFHDALPNPERLPVNLASAGSQFAGVCGELAEVFDGYAWVEDSIDVNEDAVGTAEEVAGFFRERKRRTKFRNYPSDCGEIYGFGVKQLFDKLLVLF